MRTRGGEERGLKATLVATDLVALWLAWLPALAMMGGPGRGPSDTLLFTATVLGTALTLMRHQGLYLSRRCAVRSLEVRLLVRATVATALALVVVDRIAFRALGTGIGLREIAVGSALMLPLLIVERAVFRATLRAVRQQGQHRRAVLILGTGPQAARLVHLLGDHPEHGMTVTGVLGDVVEARENALAGLRLGDIDDVERLAGELDVTGVVITPAASEHPRITTIVKHLQHLGIHVQIANGLSGFDVQRLRQLHFAHEPMIYLEQSEPGPLDYAMKRALDLFVSIAVLVFLLPVFALVAIAIKWDDRGPVLFTQTRVGRAGRLFTVYKFRTMCVDAEAQLQNLQAANERLGPLFKMERDPRVTRIGHLLRVTSLDELPQFVNVLLGTMSVVGPRPALPSEVLAFDLELRRREVLKPGITGLWQVEARDAASFDAYRRLDLFYVDNWTVGGDLQIILDTVEHLIGRLVRTTRATPVAPAVDSTAIEVPDVRGAKQTQTPISRTTVRSSVA